MNSLLITVSQIYVSVLTFGGWSCIFPQASHSMFPENSAPNNKQYWIWAILLYQAQQCNRSKLREKWLEVSVMSAPARFNFSSVFYQSACPGRVVIIMSMRFHLLL